MRTSILACTILAAGSLVSAAEVPSADVMVQFVTPSKDLKVKVRLYSHWDDTARDVQLVVVLPHGLRVAALPTICHSVPVGDGTHGRISCFIGDMNVGETRDVDFQLARVYTTGHRTVGAFVSNRLPDPVPGNNYNQGVIP